MKIVLTSQTPWKTLRGPYWSLDYTLRTADLMKILSVLGDGGMGVSTEMHRAKLVEL